LHGIQICTDLLSQFTRVTERRTDRRTEFSSLYRVCITCSKKTLSGSAVALWFI